MRLPEQLSSPAAIIISILVGFATIIVLESYSDYHRKTLSRNKTEAERLIGVWNAFEAATSGLLVSEDLSGAQREWKAATAAFDADLDRLVRSEVLTSLGRNLPGLKERVVRTEDLWRFIKFRTKHAQQYLDQVIVNESGDKSRGSRNLLIRLGYLMGRGKPNSDYLALHSLAGDIGYVVSTSGTFFTSSLTDIITQISLEVDREASRMRHVTLLLSLLITGMVIAFVVRSQRALRQSEERYRTLQTNLPLGVFRSTPDGRFLWVNPAMVEMFGYDSQEEMLAVPAADLYCDPTNREERMRLLDAAGSATDMESQMRRKDGTIIWAASSVHAVTDVSGRVLHYDGILEDITDRKHAEAVEQAAAKEKYLQAKRISGVFAHEIRNALFPARAALDKLRNRVLKENPDDRMQRFAHIAEKAVSNATATTRLISDFNKLDTEVMPQRVNLSEVVDDFLETNQVRIEEMKVGVMVTGESDLIVRSNRLQLPLVFNNLLANSLHALQGRPDPSIAITWTKQTDRLVLSFEDNGCGIAADDLERVFEPFFSTRARRGGIGIGLSTSRKILEMYGGSISVTSVENIGTRFDLTLMLSSAPR